MVNVRKAEGGGVARRDGYGRRQIGGVIGLMLDFDVFL